MEEVRVATRQRAGLVDITHRVQKTVEKSGVREGLCLVYCPHTTAAVAVNEAADPAVAEDIAATLQRLVPRARPYRHREGNAHAHIQSALLSASCVLPVQGGRLVLGTWQGVFLCEWDGPRQRRVLVQVAGK